MSCRDLLFLGFDKDTKSERNVDTKNRGEKRHVVTKRHKTTGAESKNHGKSKIETKDSSVHYDYDNDNEDQTAATDALKLANDDSQLGESGK